jgi:AcrR family transcriptional regulator
MPTRTRPPLQERSRRTLTRILEATEELLGERLLEQGTIRDIVERARTSVGAFYSRFENKEALLPALYERYDESMPRDRAQVLERLPLAPDLDSQVTQIVGAVIRLFRGRKGLMRAMALHARTHPAAIPHAVRERRSEMHATMGDLLLEHRSEIDHPDPRLAVDMGLFLAISTCRERVLFPEAPQASTTPVDDEILEREVARALHAYLRGPAPLPNS